MNFHGQIWFISFYRFNSLPPSPILCFVGGKSIPGWIIFISFETLFAHFIYTRFSETMFFKKACFSSAISERFHPPLQFSTESYEMVEARIVAKFELICYLQIFAILA